MVSSWRKGGVASDIILFVAVGVYMILEDVLTEQPTDVYAMIVWLAAECSLGVAFCRHQISIMHWPHIVAITASVKFCLFAVLLCSLPLAPGRELWVQAAMYMIVSQLLLLSATTNVCEIIENHMNPVDPYQAPGDDIQLTMDHPGYRNENTENMSEYEMIEVGLAGLKRDAGLSEIDDLGDEFVCVHQYENVLVTSEVHDGKFIQHEIII